MQTTDDRTAAALDLVERMAGWVLDGEKASDELAEHVPNKVNPDGTYVLDGDEAGETVTVWVQEARQILALAAPVAKPIAKNLSEPSPWRCPTCKERVSLLTLTKPSVTGWFHVADETPMHGVEPWSGSPAEAAIDAPEKVWTFFGHYSDADELVIEHAVRGEHADEREDDGTHAGGLWCDSGWGRTQAEAEADARTEYEHVHYVGEFNNGKPVAPGYVSVTAYSATRDQLHADLAEARAQGAVVSRLYAERVLGEAEGCDCTVEETSAFAEGYSVGYWGTKPTWYENPWQQAEYDRGLTAGRAREAAEAAAETA